MRIIALTLERLINSKHFDLMDFVDRAIDRFPIIKELFPQQVEAFLKAFHAEDEVYMPRRRSDWTEVMQGLDDVRDKGFRILRDMIKSLQLLQDQEKAGMAARLLEVIQEYGGARITSMADNAESGVLTNLVEDLRQKYQPQVEALGIGQLVDNLAQANDAFLNAVDERTLDVSEKGKEAMANARKATDSAYRGLIDTINLYIKYNDPTPLLPFIKYMNVRIDEERSKLGQSPAKPNNPTPELPSDNENPGDNDNNENQTPNNPDQQPGDNDQQPGDNDQQPGEPTNPQPGEGDNDQNNGNNTPTNPPSGPNTDAWGDGDEGDGSDV